MIKNYSFEHGERLEIGFAEIIGFYGIILAVAILDYYSSEIYCLTFCYTDGF